MTGTRMHPRRMMEIIAQTRVEYRDPAPSLDDLRWVGRALRQCLLALLLTALGGKPASRRRTHRDLF